MAISGFYPPTEERQAPAFGRRRIPDFVPLIRATCLLLAEDFMAHRRHAVRRLFVGTPAVHWPNLVHTGSNTATNATMAK
jgi:hypothetical protein